MEDNNFLTVNLSNQANACAVRKLNLSQFNLAALIGIGYLNNRSQVTQKIPVSIIIDKSGEMEIEGLDEDIDAENICIYTDKKVTRSED